MAGLKCVKCTQDNSEGKVNPWMMDTGLDELRDIRREPELNLWLN
jgi:hypothetical protein